MGIEKRRNMPMPRSSCWRWESSFTLRMTTLTSLGTLVWHTRLALTSRTTNVAGCGSVSATGLFGTAPDPAAELWAERGWEGGPDEGTLWGAAICRLCSCSYSHFVGLIKQCSATLPPAVFLRLTHKIYKRKEWSRDCKGGEGMLSINDSKS